MTPETFALVAALAFGAAGVILTLIIYKKMRLQYAQVALAARQIAELKEALALTNESIAANIQRLDEQASRIARLETRARAPRQPGDEIGDALTAFNEPVRLEMAERRRRVLTRAARGQSAETIAATLEMLPGEVVLIIDLNRAMPVQS